MPMNRVSVISGIYIIFAISALTILSCDTDVVLKIDVPPPPETKVVEVREALHGVEIVDPYRWLEKLDDPETRAWIREQNAYTDHITGQLGGREALAERLRGLMHVDTVGVPLQGGGRYFYQKRGKDQPLDSICMRDGPDGQEVVLIDPHQLSEDCSLNLMLLSVSADGKLVAYSVRKGGEDESEVNFFDVDANADMPFALGKAIYYTVIIKPDNSGCFFVRRDADGPRLYFRDFGDPPESEKLIFGEGTDFGKIMYADLSHDGRWLVIRFIHGWEINNDLYIMDVLNDGELVPVIKGVDAVFFGRVYDGKLFIRTNWNAPNGKLMVADPNNPGVENWRELVPEQEEAVLFTFTGAGERLIVKMFRDLRWRLVIYDTAGNELGEIETEAPGSLGNPFDIDNFGKWDSDEAFYLFSSFHIPNTIYRYTISDGQGEVWWRSSAPIDSEKYEIEQLWATSADGAKVPMQVCHEKGMELDGDNPLLLDGYGGFNVIHTPFWHEAIAGWLKSGGVFVFANLRGGGELGEQWHRAGMRENKQNSFDDFIAVAEFLIERGYTSKERLAIRGGSNGGLLVGAAVVQRPELFSAVYCGAPLLDMLRYHKLLLGATWVAEIGSADDPEQFEYLYKYSPYHNVKKGVSYPAIIFQVGDSDTRVSPMHAYKMAALMQAANISGEPIVLRTLENAGHLGGMTLEEQVGAYAEAYAFLAWKIGLKLD